MVTFNDIVKTTGRNFEIEKTISGYYRLMLDGEPYFDDAACEDTNGIFEDAESYFEYLLLDNEVPNDKKEMRGGIWFLK